MAVPEVTVVFPSTGQTGGRRLVQIMGQNFRLPPDPPLTGVSPAPNPSVEVLFGGVAGTRVAVVSPSRMFVLTPITPLPSSAPEGAVDVEVRNIDQNGDLVPGETVTLAGGYTYARPDIHALPSSDLLRMVRTLLHQLKKQVLPEVNLTVGTDFTDSPSEGVASIAEVPSLNLVGPNLRENRFYSQNNPRMLQDPDGFGLGEDYFGELRPARTVDLTFQIIGVTEGTMANLNLMSEVESFFQRNKTIAMEATDGDPSVVCEWEMDFEPGGDLQTIGTPNNSNIRAFRGTFVVRGFDLDDASMTVLVGRELQDQLGVGSVAVPSAVVLEDDQLGVSYPTGPSPGPGGDC